jgi:hypothetical protein
MAQIVLFLIWQKRVKETEAKFNASLIKSNKVVFRPGIDLREMQNNLKYEKA